MPASDCRSCVDVVKVLACKVKIEERIYLSMAGKGLRMWRASVINVVSSC